MRSNILLLLSSAAVALSKPVERDGSESSCAGSLPVPNNDASSTGPTLPTTGTSDTQLPSPPPGSKLVAITVGFGIQNYSCSSSDPKSTGALAQLFDITHLFPGTAPDSLIQPDFDNLPALAVHSAQPVINPARSMPGASPFNSTAPLTLPSLQPLALVGEHFFDADGNPVFDLNLPSGPVHLVASKLASVNAPPDADQGPDCTGAVAWLELGAKDGAGSTGATFVYRVETAGGNSHGCLTGPEDSSPYAAQYWFFQ